MQPVHPPPTTAAPPTVAQLPVRLRDLLKREVCLEISRAHIEAALAQVQQEAEELKKTRPPFLFLHAKPTRTDFQAREAGASESLVALTNGLKNVVNAQPRLRAWVEDDLETFLRDSQLSYMQGLATHRFPDDWQRALLRFDQRVAGFRAALGQMQAALGAVPNEVLLASHAGKPVFTDFIIGRVWRDSPGTTADTVRVHMSALRKKIEPDSSSPRYIVTEPWVGYRFIAEPV